MVHHTFTIIREAFMTLDIDAIIKQPWKRYDVPEVSVSGEFPSAPLEDISEDDQEETASLFLETQVDGLTIAFDLDVNVGRSLDVDSSKELALRLREDLEEEQHFEVLSVDPRPYQDFPGVIQRMRLKETGEFHTQWLIAAPFDTVFVGVTFADKRLEELAERFFAGITITESADEDTGVR
ncbi:MAG: hypothetical protein ACK5GN_11700 [Pseudomonadota bacterium]